VLNEAERIHCCFNGCQLFWGENVDAARCSECGEARFAGNGTTPRKVYYYVPLMPRIKNLFSVSATAELVRYPLWRRKYADVINDVQDSTLWTDYFQPLLGEESDTNLALSLYADGIRLTESKQTSVTPLLINPLNVPPWVRYKRCFFWLTGLVPGRVRNFDCFLGKHHALL
jgi:hypothetical protein